MTERDDKPEPATRADSLRDFPEEFEQRPDGPARDLARRGRVARENAEARESALARIEAMKRRVRELAEKSE